MGAAQTKGRSSRGPRWGASVSLAEEGCGRQKGGKDEAGDTVRDQSLWGLCVLPKSRLYLRVLGSSKKILKQGVNMMRIAYENDIL